MAFFTECCEIGKAVVLGLSPANDVVNNEHVRFAASSALPSVARQGLESAFTPGFSATASFSIQGKSCVSMAYAFVAARIGAIVRTSEAFLDYFKFIAAPLTNLEVSLSGRASADDRAKTASAVSERRRVDRKGPPTLFTSPRGSLRARMLCVTGLGTEFLGAAPAMIRLTAELLSAVQASLNRQRAISNRAGFRTTLRVFFTRTDPKFMVTVSTRLLNLWLLSHEGINGADRKSLLGVLVGY